MNGQLLLPNLDRAFDCGLISFDDAGNILLSAHLKEDIATALNIHPNMRLRTITPAHLLYLQHHRHHVFQGTR